MISDSDLRKLENEMTKALFTMFLNGDIEFKSATYIQDDKPTMTLQFGNNDTVVVTIKAERQEEKEE